MKKQNDEERLLPKDVPSLVGMYTTLRTIPIDAIANTEMTQIRESYSEETVSEFERIYRDNSSHAIQKLPPIVVVPCPGHKDKYWILDGHHRYRAASRTMRNEIEAYVVTLDKKNYLDVKNIEDLQFLQARENGKTIANRTRETKRRQVRAALVKRPHWTNRQIAYYCTVSFELVDAVRREMEKEGTIAASKKPAEKAAEAVANPDNDKKSNRQIAKETGVGEATVRRLRQNSKSKNDAPKKPICACCGCYCVSDNPIYVKDKDGETTLPFCDNVCAERYAADNGLNYDDDDKRLYSSEDDALNNVSKKAQEFIDNNAPAEPAKQPYEKPEVLDEPPSSADDKAEPAETSSHVTKSGSIPLRNPDNILMVVEDVINWLGSGRIEYFATIFNDKISNPQ